MFSRIIVLKYHKNTTLVSQYDMGAKVIESFQTIVLNCSGPLYGCFCVYKKDLSKSKILVMLNDDSTGLISYSEVKESMVFVDEQAGAVVSFGMELNSRKLSVVTVTIIVELAFLWRVQLLLLKELVVT